MCKHEVEVIVISLELDFIRAYEHIKLYYVYILHKYLFQCGVEG